MAGTVSRRRVLAALASSGAAAALAGCAEPPPSRAKHLPDQLVWSTYSAGTGTYNDVAAIATVLTQELGTQVRLMTGDTGISRLAPLFSGTADYVRAGDEYFYAFEGDDEFAYEHWGPQPIRLVWTPPGNYGVCAIEGSGIESPADLAGRKVPRLIASTAINRKIEAYLNFGGLTWADVDPVPISYGNQPDGLFTGQIDVMYQNVVGAGVEELATRRDLRWLDITGGAPEQYATWPDLCPMVTPGEFTEGAGLGEGESAPAMVYSIPLTTLQSRDRDEVNELCHAIDTYFPKFKDRTPDADSFHPDELLLEPFVAPLHEGAVDYLKETGRWDESRAARQDALLEREGLLNEHWPRFLEAYDDPEERSERWRAWKSENLPAPGTKEADA